MGFGVPFAEAGVRESSGSALGGTPAMQNPRFSRMQDPSKDAAGAGHTGEIPVPCTGRGDAREKPPALSTRCQNLLLESAGRLWNAEPTVLGGFIHEGAALSSGEASNRGRDLRLLGLIKLPALPGECGGAKALLRWK